MVSRPLRVPVGRLRRHRGGAQREVVRGPIRGLSVAGSGVPPPGEVALDVLLEAVHTGILATGTVRTTWEGECRRCLAQARGQVEVEVCELFEEGAGTDDTYRLYGDELDLEPMARDAVLLELPQAPLCSEGCLGLCQRCGANLNDGPCACDGPG